MPELDHVEKAAAGKDESSAANTNLLDLHKDQEVKLSKSNLLMASEHTLAMPLTTYIQKRDEQESKQTYFTAATTYLTRLGRRAVGARDASSEFDEARKSGNQAIMMSLYDEDRSQRKFEHYFGRYTSAALQTGFLFTGGKLGLAGLTTVATTDSAKPADPFPEQAIDATLGAARGIATRFVFNKINELDLNPVTKGWMFGVSDRFIDVGLNRRTYLDEKGGLDLAAGAKKTFLSVAGPQALIADAGTAAVTHAVLLPINAYTKGSYFANALASKLTMAGVSGLTNGSLRELNHQQWRGKEPIDWVEVAKKGVEKGAIDTISALPGSRLF